MDLKNTPITLQIFKSSSNVSEPFDANNNILTPLSFIVEND